MHSDEGVTYCLRPGSIRRRTIGAVPPSILDGKREELSSNSGGILVDDSKGSEDKTAVTDAVPVSVDASPPAIVGSAGMSQETVAKAEVGDRPANSIELIRGPRFVEPVIGDGECSSQLGDIEEVAGVPVVASITPSNGPIARGVLPKQVS